MSDDPSVPKGRLKRLTRIAGMATRVGAGLAADRVKRLLGAQSAGADVAAATQVLETLGTLKGAAMKAGQTLSLFANQLPPEARAIIGRLFESQPVDSLLERLSAAGVPCGRVRTIDQVLRDPQLAARQMLIDIPAGAGSVKVPGNPVKLSDVPAIASEPPPALGQHTEEVKEWVRRRQSADA